jgi:hypothetical protein
LGLGVEGKLSGRLVEQLGKVRIVRKSKSLNKLGGKSERY